MPYSEQKPYVTTTLDALQSLNADTLKRLLKLLPTSERPTRKADLVAVVYRHLEGDALHTLWRKLSALQQAAVAEAVHGAGGRLHEEKFRAKYGESPDWGTKGQWGDDEPSLLGLFFYGGVIPDDMRRRLSEFVPPPAATSLKTVDAVPDVRTFPVKIYNQETRTYDSGTYETPIRQHAAEPAALAELSAVLRLVEAGKVAVSDKTLMPTATTIKAIRDLLQEGDFYDELEAGGELEQEEIPGPIRAFAWPMLLQGGKLASLSGKKLALTRAGEKALTTPSHETLRAVWQNWIKTTVLDEFRRINAIKGQTGKGQRSFTALSGRRQAIAGALAQCPVSRWVDVDLFFRYMQAAGHDFEVTRDEWSLYISDPNYGSLGYSYGHSKWPILQGRYVLCVLFEVAATLGLVDVAFIPPGHARTDYRDMWGTDDHFFLSRYDGLLFFRLTPLGAYCLGHTDTYTPARIEPRSFLRVLPNLDIVVTETAFPKGDALVLDFYATRTSERVWKLEATGLLTAVEQGRSVSELQEFLEARSDTELPSTVTRLLTEHRERAERLKERGTATLIECSDPKLLELIVHDPRTKRHCYPAGDRHFVILPGSDTAFRKALRQLGYVIPTGRGNLTT
jgi:hypothetical protein